MVLQQGRKRSHVKEKKSISEGEEAVNTWWKDQSVMSAERLDNRISSFLTNFCIRTVSHELHMPHSIPRRVRKLDLDALTTTELRKSIREGLPY